MPKPESGHNIIGTMSYGEAIETGSFVPDCGATMDSAHLDRRKFLQVHHQPIPCTKLPVPTCWILDRSTCDECQYQLAMPNMPIKQQPESYV